MEAPRYDDRQLSSHMLSQPLCPRLHGTPLDAERATRRRPCRHVWLQDSGQHYTVYIKSDEHTCRVKLYLVILSRATQSPALTHAFKLSAPCVSMASKGTLAQPTRCKPSSTPFISPPPPTDTTIRSGVTPYSCSLISSTKEACPYLFQH